MPSPSDIADPTFREALRRIESLMDEGDFTGASKHAAETYLVLLDKRPDLVSGASTGAHTPLAMSRAVAWPPTGGVTMQVSDGKPALVYAKERFSMSEAYGYFEFLMNLLWNLQNERNL
jgi:hypothetical protein